MVPHGNESANPYTAEGNRQAVPTGIKDLLKISLENQNKMQKKSIGTLIYSVVSLIVGISMIVIGIYCANMVDESSLRFRFLALMGVVAVYASGKSLYFLRKGKR